ncbi:MAG: RloB family protein [Clostridia bacterium]
MGSDDIFKKKKKAREKRKSETKKPKPNSYLIVTEGERTEPLYFRGLTDLITKTNGGFLQVVPVPFVEIHGEGRSTISLINKTDEIVNKSKIIFQNVWLVFDKDDFLDFDEAINIANAKGYNLAWSNQCFEYWLYLHFYYSDAALHRQIWKEKLDEIFTELNLGNGKYEKNYEDIYDIVSTNGNVITAIQYAKRRMANFNPTKDKASEYDPGTTVHKLVIELQNYLNE